MGSSNTVPELLILRSAVPPDILELYEIPICNRREDMDFKQIKMGHPDTITAITDDTIYRIAEVKLFSDSEMNRRLRDLHQDLLWKSKTKNKHREVGFFWNLSNLDDVKVIYGKENGLFSGRDIESFADFMSIYAMTAVCNDGTIYTMVKLSEFDPILLKKVYNEGIGKGMYSGMKNVAKHASKIGIKYHCSVKRR